MLQCCIKQLEEGAKVFLVGVSCVHHELTEACSDDVMTER